jgi:hypothetical protein
MDMSEDVKEPVTVEQTEAAQAEAPAASRSLPAAYRRDRRAPRAIA